VLDLLTVYQIFGVFLYWAFRLHWAPPRRQPSGPAPERGWRAGRTIFRGGWS